VQLAYTVPFTLVHTREYRSEADNTYI